MRETGYYWVKRLEASYWEIAEWMSDEFGNGWSVQGNNDFTLLDRHMSAINETRILNPDEPIFSPYNKEDVRLGDIYAYKSNDGDNLVEVCENEDKTLYLSPIRCSYWKASYDYIPNDYMTDFDAVLVYRILNPDESLQK